MKFIRFLLFILIITTTIIPQIRFKHYPGYSVSQAQIKELEGSQLRETMLLNGKWQVYSEKDKERNKSSVMVPSVYDGQDELVFEKKFTLSKELLDRKLFQLNFLGVNYSADISVNNSVIFRHTGGAFPFSIMLPKDLLKPGADANALRIHIIPRGDERNTIPLSHGYLFPSEFAGIFRDVYITMLPNVAVQRYTVTTEAAMPGRAKLHVEANILNRSFSSLDSAVSTGYELRVSAIPFNSNASEVVSTLSFDVRKGKEKDIQLNMEIASPSLWTPDAPSLYKIKLEILHNGTIIDDVYKNTAVYQLKGTPGGLSLNNQPFALRGVTYVPAFESYGVMMTYEQMRQDMLLIKETGFNTVRFTKAVPHPYMLQLCAQYGLIAFIDMPIEHVPASLLSDNLFFNNAKNFYNQCVSAYGNESAVAAIGLGSGFSGVDEGDIFFITQMSEIIHQRSKKMTYEGFLPQTITTEVPGVDLYGVETIGVEITDLVTVYARMEAKVGRGKTFLMGAGYWANEESSNGYANPNTFEAQAKFFNDILDYADEKQMPAVFLHTMFDYRTDYTSMVGKYNDKNLLLLGIASEERGTDRTAYKLVYAALHNLQKITVPIGVKKDKSPFVFILFGLGLALLIGVLINSGRKFREDAVRALVRPYNFFADVRDLRIFSAVQSLVLGALVSSVLALLTESYIYFFRQNETVEKLALATTSDTLMGLLSFLAWNPTPALLILTCVFFIMLAIIAGLIRVAATGVINKVYYSSSFYVVVWAFIPVLLLTPFGIVLYRILVPQTANAYIYGASILFTAWIAMRVLKGAYVIYDTTAARVYIFGFAIILLFLGTISAYLQYYYMALDFVFHAFREFRLGL
ncbi:MAG: hypothetical protein HYV28_14480 [Ignavibacteriales bacterium]|nr:hypothetical protein [Ignavibacteriales bacterium]